MTEYNSDSEGSNRGKRKQIKHKETNKKLNMTCPNNPHLMPIEEKYPQEEKESISVAGLSYTNALIQSVFVYLQLCMSEGERPLQRAFDIHYNVVPYFMCTHRFPSDKSP